MTNKKQTLIDSELRYRRLFEAAQDGILILSFPDGRIEDANPFMLNLIGYSRDQIIGKQLWEIGFIADKELAQATSIKLNQDRYVRYDNLNLCTADGKSIEVEFVANVYSINDLSVIQCNVRDISAMRKAERELARLVELDNQYLLDVVSALSNAIEARDAYTAGHQAKVADLAEAIGKEIGLSDPDIEGVRLAASIHDIGKIAIPAEILTKPSPLSEYEFAMLRNHVQVGYDIVKPLKFHANIAKTILQHHERLDGSGYPNKLRGEQICIEARILSVADIVEAMSSDRPYRKSQGLNVALEKIKNGRNTLYDASVVDACLNLFAEKGYTFPSN